MSQASLPLVKWISNSEAIAEVFHREFQDNYISAKDIKVLGLKWLAKEDCFSFDGVNISENLLVKVVPW